ncbi:cysteine desulfurase [bacterium]|nr:cysteine desulfurase [bacterium]
MDSNILAKIREDFPILETEINGYPLVYLDNAATTLKPKYVIDRLSKHYLYETSNIHRGVHFLSQQATTYFEEVRDKVKNYLHGNSTWETIFTKGTTGAINFVAQSFGSLLESGDEVIISQMEHHSNIVPWQMLRDRKSIVLKVAQMDERGVLDLEHLESLITEKTKLVSITYLSNALGTINPVDKIVEIAHSKNIPVLIDAAQAIAHITIDVKKLDIDFIAFSAHKMFGPTGVGVLYAKKQLLEKMPPIDGGGDMIASVRFDKTIYNTIPYRFEAGTPDIAGVIALGAAIDYINSIGLKNIEEYEHELLQYGTQKLSEIKNLRVVGTSPDKSSVISFVLNGIHPHDVGSLLDSKGIAVRTGHHCAQPVMEFFKIPATTRASISFYNTKTDIDRLVDGILYVQSIFE